MVSYETPALRLVLAVIVAVAIMISTQGRGAAMTTGTRLPGAGVPTHGISAPAGVRR